MPREDSMTEQIRISAKNLGEVALDYYCPRCFWIKLRFKDLPYQIFPGIFSSIDSYSKKMVHGWFDQYRSAPQWLSELGDLVGYRNPPHHSRFKLLDEKYNILLTGSPDGVLERRDGSRIIVDYKTAKFTDTQDFLYPMYETQLNVYARLGNELGLAPVSSLALIYMDPVTDLIAPGAPENHRADGFVLGFSAKIKDVPIRPDMIPPLLAETRRVYDAQQPPPGRAGCKECPIVQEMVTALTG